MAARYRYRKVTCALCALAAMLATAFVRGPLGADGPLLDLLIWARATAFSSDVTPETSPVAVIAIDARSLFESELAPYPRTFLAPVWATVMEGVFAAGARAVGFDLLFAYTRVCGG